jgi:hypothetical protein
VVHPAATRTAVVIAVATTGLAALLAPLANGWRGLSTLTALGPAFGPPLVARTVLLPGLASTTVSTIAAVTAVTPLRGLRRECRAQCHDQCSDEHTFLVVSHRLIPLDADGLYGPLRPDD